MDLHGPPDCRLAVNLLWTRSWYVKWVGIVLLVLAAWFHGSVVGGMNPHVRALKAIERLAENQPFGVAIIQSHVKVAQVCADVVLFDVRFGLTLGVIFAGLPADVVTILLELRRKRALRP